MPSSAPRVMTPMPPTPVISRFHGCAVAGSLGIGKSGQFSPSTTGAALRSRPPSTVTKLGQKPLRQEKSWLHAD